MQPPNTYEIGQTVLLEGKTTDADGGPIAPDNPRILLRDPAGAESSLTVELGDEVGTWFHALHLTGPAGHYAYRLVTDTDADEHEFDVAASVFAAPLGTLTP